MHDLAARGAVLSAMAALYGCPLRRLAAYDDGGENVRMDESIEHLAMPEVDPAAIMLGGSVDVSLEPRLPVQAPVGVAETLPRARFTTILLYSAANLGISLVGSLFGSAMPKYLDSYHLRPELIGLLSTERAVIGGLIAPALGHLSDRTRTRWGRRRPYFLLCVPLMAITLLVLGIHPPPVVVVLAIAVAGVAYAVSDPYLALMADIAPPDQRGQVGAGLGVAGLLGNLAFTAVAGLLWVRHEFAVFLCVAVGLLITFGLTFFTVREPLNPRVAPPIHINPLRYLRELLGYRELTKLLIAVTLGSMAGGAAPFTILFMTKTLRAPTGQAFFLLLMSASVTAIGMVPAGLLSGRIGKKWVLVGGGALGSVGALLAAQAPTVDWLIMPLILLGLNNAAISVLIVPLLVELIPIRRMGELLGVCGLILAIAAAIGAVCAGHLVNSAQPVTYRYTLIWAGVLGLCDIAILLTVHPERARASLIAEDSALAPTMGE